MKHSVLEVTQVAQRFRTGFWLKPITVLSGVSVKIERGQVVGLLGANGAGKTTFMHLVAGLRRPSEGTVRLFGKDPTDPRARSSLGYLPERPYFHSHLKGEQFLRYLGTLSGLTSADLKEKIPRALKRVGLSHVGKLELHRYSKGMLQRIGLAQALLHDPEFLMLDEPMSGLDPIGRKQMRELLLEIAAEGRTILFSSHFVPDVVQICGELMIFKSGRCVAQGKTTELTKDRTLEEYL